VRRCGVETMDPRPFRWTKEAFYQALDAGCFLERRVELIGGEIVEMAAQKNFHALGVTFTADGLKQAFGLGHWVRVQASLDLSPHSVPDPDIAVVLGSPRSHAATNTNPTTAVLIVEVALTTLSYDRNAKGSLYAASGIADYWILNLVDRQLEVYRDPVADPTRPFGFRYASRTDHGPADSVSPLAAPGASVAVADLLP
jgi:Uma2 family endonuclease